MIDYEELEHTGKCPFCGYHNKPEYTGSHVVEYVCDCCGFSTKFINPNDGFREDELPNYDEGDDAGFQDAVEQAEKDDLDSSNIEYHEPDKTVMEGVKVMAVFSRINETAKEFIKDIIELDDDKKWRLGEIDAVKFLIVQVFTEY